MSTLCRYPIDWTATGTMLTGIGTIGGALSVIGAAWFGANTFDKWRDQKLAERKALQAEKILDAIHRARIALSRVRNPFMGGNELERAEKDLKERSAWPDAATDSAKRSIRHTQAIYIRINEALEDRLNLIAIIPLARAYFGGDIENHILHLNGYFNRVQVNADMYAEGMDGLEPDLQSEMRNALWEGRTNNPFDASVAETITYIENICQPALMMTLDETNQIG